MVQAWSSQNPSALHLRIRFTILRLATVWCKPSLHRVLRSTSCAYAFYNTAFCNSVVQARPSQNPCALCPAHMHFTILSLVKTRCKPDLHRILVLCILRICILQHCVLQQCGASPAFTESLCSVSCAYAFHNTVFGKNAVQAQPSQNPCALHPAHMHFTILRFATLWCKLGLHRLLALRILRMHILQHCVWQQCGASPAFTDSLRSASCAYAFTILRLATTRCKPSLHRFFALCVLCICILQHCVSQQCGASPVFT